MSAMTERGVGVDLVIVGKDISLKPFELEHISDRYVRWLNDPEVNRFLEVRFVRQTPETALAFVRSFDGPIEKYMWGIWANKHPEMIGTATLMNIDRHHGTAVLGLMIGERAWWGGYTAIEAVELIMQAAFQRLGLRRLSGATYATNYGMNFIFKRSGFTCEGKSRQACMVSPGVYVDGHVWAILVDEWRARMQRHDTEHAGFSNSNP